MTFDLANCRTAIGNRTIIRTSPHMWGGEAVLHPAVWGLFDQGRKLVTESAYFRGPIPELIGGQYTLDVGSLSHIAMAPPAEYYYVGHCPQHYGHFLLTFFSRLWALRNSPEKRFTLVAHSRPDVKRQPYIEEFLNSVGYNMSDIEVFDEPTLFRHITVPAPSFEESNFACAAFNKLCYEAAIQIRLTAPRRDHPYDKPVYLAKTALGSGVANLSNEAVIVDQMLKHGVEVVCPETLSLAEQIRLFREAPCVAGLAGSAFHNAAFAQGRKLVQLSYTDTILSNQLLIDKLNNHRSAYVFSQSGVDEVEQHGFAIRYSIRSPSRVASDLLMIIDAMLADKPLWFPGYQDRKAIWRL